MSPIAVVHTTSGQRVEAFVGPGLPSFDIVTAPSARVREIRDRVRAACLSLGFDWPLRRVTVRVFGELDSACDVAILAAVLGASGVDAPVLVPPLELRLDGVPVVPVSREWRGECCSDCLFLIANGDTPPELDEVATGQWLAEIDRRTEGWHLALGDEEVDFSWSQCDVCGSTLGGSRYGVVGFR